MLEPVPVSGAPEPLGGWPPPADVVRTDSHRLGATADDRLPLRVVVVVRAVVAKVVAGTAGVAAVVRGEAVDHLVGGLSAHTLTVAGDPDTQGPPAEVREEPTEAREPAGGRVAVALDRAPESLGAVGDERIGVRACVDVPAPDCRVVLPEGQRGRADYAGVDTRHAGRGVLDVHVLVPAVVDLVTVVAAPPDILAAVAVDAARGVVGAAGPRARPPAVPRHAGARAVEAHVVDGVGRSAAGRVVRAP